MLTSTRPAGRSTIADSSTPHMWGARLAGLSSPERGFGLDRQVPALWPWISQFLPSCLTIVIAAIRIGTHGGSGGHIRLRGAGETAEARHDF